ncbi:MAG TPA: FAD/NAD(P)-binding protein [Flavobacteriales bacterium]|nr:FAD/NAD(P)-binding protein [Flavobacteriales bacterium]
MQKKQKIAIIGGGFSGTMTAVQLSRMSSTAEITLINDKINFNRGIAFNPYSKKHLLNVPTARMSAFQEQPDHFLDWIVSCPDFKEPDRALMAGAFLPRHYFGSYLEHIWNENFAQHGSRIKIIHDEVVQLECSSSYVHLKTHEHTNLIFDFCVLANGNSLPRNPSIPNTAFFSGKNYFQNPWSIDSVKNTDPTKPVLIIGNGLTMVDTIIGLKEQGFNQTIYSISPHGFNILPHRHPGLKYTGLTDALDSTNDLSLLNILRLVNKHIKLVRSYGVSAEPVIDSLRPYTQKFWMCFSENEKRLFLSRLRHLWGVARHRIPLHIHDIIQQMRIDGDLKIIAGKLIEIKELDNNVNIRFYNHRKKSEEIISASRVINCTGPESDISRLGQHFLNRCLQAGIIEQDKLKMGINANPETFEIIGNDKKTNSRLFAIGSNLRGVLWESTAVGELRKHAQQVAQTIASRL